MSKSNAAEKITPLRSPVLSYRVDIVLLVAAYYSNPRGEIDNKNKPTQDRETGHGLIPPVCQKAKVRRERGERGERMYIHGHGVKSLQVAKAANNHGLDTFEDEEEEKSEAEEADKKSKKKKSKKKNPTPEDIAAIVKAMSADYWDVRTFGAVLNNPYNEGIRGPVQFSTGVSVEPISILDTTVVSRMVANESEKKTKKQTFGHMSVVPYGLYKHTISLSAADAARTGFTEADLESFIEALQYMFENDASTLRPNMAVERIVVFRHDSPYGNYPRNKLYKRVDIKRKDSNGVLYSLPLSDAQMDKLGPARDTDRDYNISVNTEGLPEAVKVEVID